MTTKHGLQMLLRAQTTQIILITQDHHAGDFLISRTHLQDHQAKARNPERSLLTMDLRTMDLLTMGLPIMGLPIMDLLIMDPHTMIITISPILPSIN